MKTARWILRLLPAFAATVAAAAAARAQSLEATDGSPIELRSLTVATAVEGRVARVSLDEVFSNPGDRDLEAQFWLPLPGGAAVDGFSLWIDGKEETGELLGAGRAREVYEGIVRTRKDPGILELAGDRLLRARVFPVPARGERRIRVSWTEVLSGDAGSVSWRFPLRFPPRSLGAGARASIGVEVATDRPLAAAWCPTHRAEVVRRDDRHARVSWESAGTIPERDFVLVIQEPSEGLGFTLVPSRPAGEASGTFLLVLAPGVEANEAPLPRDLVLCLDTSGSMAGEKIVQARAALRHAVRTLGPGDRFGIVAFASEPRAFRPALVPAAPDNLEAALAWIDRLEATGGTAMDEALRASLALLRDGDGSRSPTLLFLTDGLPTEGETDEGRILGNARTAAGERARAFVFGVGEDVNARLLDSLAEGLRGARDYVAPQEDIERKVSALVDKTRHPVLTDLALEVEGVAVADLCPRRLPDLFRGNELVVAGRYEGTGEAVVRIRARSGAGTQTFERKVVFPEKAEGAAFVDRLWAVRRVGSLMDQMRLHGEAKELRDEIVRLARKHGIVTRYTSRLVLEEPFRGRLAARGNGPDRPPRTAANRPRDRVPVEEEVDPDALETRPIDEQEKVVESTMLDESKVDNESEAEAQEVQEALGNPRFDSESPFEGRGGNFAGGAAIGVCGGAGGMFGGRRGLHRNQRAEGGGATEGVTESGLEWLKKHQSHDGNWDTDGFEGRTTGLALLAFLGYGETHKTPRYGSVVRSGLKHLKGIQDSGGCFGPRGATGFLRRHAVSALAMAEAYGLTQSPLFKASAQNGIDFLLSIRNPGAGWGDGAGTGDSDILTTAWAVFALKSAASGGLRVDPAALDEAGAWLARAAESPSGAVSSAEAAAALAAWILAGADPGDASFRRLADRVLAVIPTPGETEALYFGTLAAFQVGGDGWKKWNEAMKKAVIDTQRGKEDLDSRGSWDPANPADMGARTSTTAYNGMCLEVNYRYARVFGARQPSNASIPPAPSTGSDAISESQEAKSLSEATSADEAEGPGKE